MRAAFTWVLVAFAMMLPGLPAVYNMVARWHWRRSMRRKKLQEDNYLAALKALKESIEK